MQRGDSVPATRVLRDPARERDASDVWHFDGGAGLQDQLPEERPILIEINGHPVGRLLASPADLAPLAAGWVFAHGFARDMAEIRTVTARGDRVSVMIDAPGPGGKTWESLLAAGFDARHTTTRASLISELIPLAGPDQPGAVRLDRADGFRTVERLFEQFKRERGCGGYHFAGGAGVTGIGRVVRDVSRHNAVDKLVGWSIVERREPLPVLVALSGRVSADIVFKAWRAGIPVLATRSLPTAEAVAMAEHAGITVVGRVLTAQRSVYTHVWRFGAGSPGSRLELDCGSTKGVT